MPVFFIQELEYTFYAHLSLPEAPGDIQGMSSNFAMIIIPLIN
jgi:hypothetical protein